MKTGICNWAKRGVILLGFCALTSLSSAQSRDAEIELTDLDDFVIYAEPEVMDALRKRPYSKKNPVVEAFFHALPSLNNQIYQENLAKMRQYLQRAKQDKHGKLSRLAKLAGLDTIPAGLIEGYDDRIDILETLLEWMERDKPIQLKRIDVWKESELRYRLARRPIENIRLNPETDELESRLFFDWKLIFQDRPKARDLKLNFDMGIQLQEQTGYYNPEGFLHLSQLRKRDLSAIDVSYPIIVTEALEDNLDAELPKYLSAYRTTMNSFYHILQEYFFSDLADIHSLYILTRGEIFADEWGQYQSTALQRGLAAYLVFRAYEETHGATAVRELQKNDWTTWHIRKIGNEYNPITWEGEKAPSLGYGEYKRSLNMRNIYWSTLFVQSLADHYGESFVFDMCRAMKARGGRATPSDDEVFEQVTGDDLNEKLIAFADENSAG